MTVTTPDLPKMPEVLTTEARDFWMAYRQALLSQASAIGVHLGIPDDRLTSKIRRRLCVSCRHMIETNE